MTVGRPQAGVHGSQGASLNLGRAPDDGEGSGLDTGLETTVAGSFGFIVILTWDCLRRPLRRSDRGAIAQLRGTFGLGREVVPQEVAIDDRVVEVGDHGHAAVPEARLKVLAEAPQSGPGRARLAAG